MTFFRVLADDRRFRDRWFLDEPVAADGSELDAREFRYGRPYAGPMPCCIPIGRTGREVAFNLAAFDMPVVRNDLLQIMRTTCNNDMQVFPVQIEGAHNKYSIVNVTSLVQCIDESRSVFQKWTPVDRRPDKNGHFRAIFKLVLDPHKIGDEHMFRLWGSCVELVVSHRLKELVESVDSLGVVFDAVS